MVWEFFSIIIRIFGVIISLSGLVVMFGSVMAGVGIKDSFLISIGLAVIIGCAIAIFMWHHYRQNKKQKRSGKNAKRTN